MRTIRKIEQTMPSLRPRKKVAAYARVSMESERMHHSLSAQISYYSSLIQKNPEWEYAGVYADYGISGTGIKKRQEFRRMLEDAKAGRIDIILTKSIQRFARNTVDLLRTVRHLKKLGIEVWFEKENIHTMSGDGELMLTILASFAQEESRSISTNVKWGTRKRFAKGIPNGRFRIYGYRWKGDQLVIEPKEAAMVKLIYDNFLNGLSAEATEKQLAERGVKSSNGKHFSNTSIRAILKNITYTGNLLFQKEYVTDPITGKTKRNRGELPQYFVENTHEAIIPMEIYKKVQAEQERRRKLGALANWSINTCCFTSKIKCGICGRSYVHNVRSESRRSQDCWLCCSHKEKGRTCRSRGSIPQKILIQECNEVLGLEEFDEKTFLDRVDKIVVPEQHTMVFHMKNGEEITRYWTSTAKTDWWTPERRKEWGERHKLKSTNPNRKAFNEFTGFIKCGNCGENYRSQQTTYINGKTERYWRCFGTCGNTSIKDSTMKKLTASVLGTASFDEERMDELLEKAVIKNGEVIFYFKDGHTEARPYKDRKYGCRHSEAYKKYMSELTKLFKSKAPDAKAKIEELKAEWRRENNRWKEQ